MSTGTEELEPAAVRRARPDDVPAIAAIYGHAVRTRIAAFRHVGTPHEGGRTFDRWIDTAWDELRLEP